MTLTLIGDSPQEQYDIVVEHLLTMPRRSFDVHINGCAYRTPDGNRCAAGVLIRDEDYDPAMEQQNIETLIGEQSGNMLSVLQRFHDATGNWMPPPAKDANYSVFPDEAQTGPLQRGTDTLAELAMIGTIEGLTIPPILQQALNLV